MINKFLFIIFFLIINKKTSNIMGNHPLGKPKIIKCNNFQYFVNPHRCKRYHDKVKNCSKRDRMLFGQNCKKQGKLFDKVFTSAKSWPELWQQIKDFSLADKINSLEKYLDKYSLGAGPIILEVVFPKVAVTRLTSEALKKIKNGEMPIKAISTVGMALLLQYAIGNEVDVLEISEKALADKAVQDKLLKSKTGKKAIKSVAKKLSRPIREKVYTHFEITDDI